MLNWDLYAKIQEDFLKNEVVTYFFSFKGGGEGGESKVLQGEIPVREEYLKKYVPLALYLYIKNLKSHGRVVK